jgi:hypothetical protein
MPVAPVSAASIPKDRLHPSSTSFWNVDLQVKKNVQINERFSFEFQSIFTNVFNHHQLLDPFLQLGGSRAIRRSKLARHPPRSIEIVVRIRF